MKQFIFGSIIFGIGFVVFLFGINFTIQCWKKLHPKTKNIKAIHRTEFGQRMLTDTTFIFYEKYSNGHISAAIYGVDNPKKLSAAQDAIMFLSNYNSLNTHAKIRANELLSKSMPKEIENLTGDTKRISSLIAGYYKIMEPSFSYRDGISDRTQVEKQ